MFTAFISLTILCKVVFANYPGDKLTSDETLGHFQVSSFLFQNESIRLNITWQNPFGNDSVREISLESYNMDEECIYSSTHNVSNHTNIIVPSLDIIDAYENIFPGCIYTINADLEGRVITENYTVPECVENYCACLTNLIKLVDVELTQGHFYRIHYTSQNPSLEKGNYYITKVFYVKQDTEDSFDVPELKYFKGSFEIPMEYLKDGDNYTLVIQYKEVDNVNPYCEHMSRLSFKAQFDEENHDYLIMKTIIIFIIFFFAMILCIFVRYATFSTKTLERVKRLLFPVYEESPTIQTLKKTSFSLPHQKINTLYTPLELSVDPFEFPRENIIIKDVVGSGAFGNVYYAKAYNLNGLPGFTMVAVKLLREGAPKEELADFLAEIKMLRKVGVHKNIVKFLACVTRSQPYMTIMELVANGDLKEYLLKLRAIWVKNKNQRLFFPDDMEEKHLKTNDPNPKARLEGIATFGPDIQTPLLSDMGARPEPALDHRELENFAFQIATGMAYLESIPVTHRDLAARNVLITKEKVLKISDFGMSRSGPYVNRNLKKVPLRWMAIEAIEDFKTDSKSDVWSFGVVLWEIGTLGAFPYEDIPNELIPKALISGIRLPRPEICTDDLYSLMQRCWREDPKDRPSFSDIVEHFNAKNQHVYVDFKRVNPKYVFPPTDPE